MSKVGILTFHNNENRGAILQAYSLRETINEIFSVEVEIVDYRARSKEQSRRNGLFISRRPQKIFRRIKDRRLIESSLSSPQIPTSSKSIVTDDQNEAVNWINDQDYDLLITGSDEVWKISSGDRGRLFSSLLPNRPFPNLYFLDPRISAMKTAYAASANSVDLNILKEHQRETLERYLSDYDYISVRDNHTEDLLNNLGIGSVHRVPDPTLLVDLPMGDAVPILKNNGIDLDKPILGFHGPRNPVFKKICEKYRERGYQIVTSTNSPYADVELEGKVDPFEYYAVYDHYDMVVTSSLHSTIFSLKNGTPFVTIDVDDAYATLESKTHSLLQDFSLLNRHIDAVDGDATEFHDRIDELEQPLDEDHVQKRISKLRETGLEYLEMVKQDYEENN